MATFIKVAPVLVATFVVSSAMLPHFAKLEASLVAQGTVRCQPTALEKGAGRAVGVDIDPERIRDARDLTTRKGFESLVSFVEGDVMDANLSDATLVLCYLITAASVALKPKFEAELKPGTRVVMESFPVPGWRPVETRQDGYKTFYLYKMPPEAMSETALEMLYPGY